MILVLQRSAHEVSTADRLIEGKRYPTEASLFAPPRSEFLFKSTKLAEFQVGRRFTAISPPLDCMLQYICLARAIEVSPVVPGRYLNDVNSARQANSIQLFCDSAR